MDIKVSSDTITKITSAPEFAGAGPLPPAPSVADLIKTTHQNLKNEEARLQNRITAANDNISPDGVVENNNKALSKISNALKNIQRQQQRFDEMVKEVPEGFRLAPVFYNRITQEANAQIQTEYEYSVRPRFLRFLAANHAEDLKKLGICEKGIARMQKGLDPADANGQLYHISIDHIVERSGCGLWAESKETDPDQPPEASPKYRTNHFGNLIFLPEQVHTFKNELNNIQRVTDTPPGEGRWVLMMVPVRNDIHAGYVCPPQPKHHALHGVNFRTDDLDRQIGHASFTAQQALSAIHPLKKSKIIRQLVTTLDTIAERHKTTVTGLARRELRKADVTPRLGIARIFNEVSAYDRAMQEHIHTALAPALLEAAEQLKMVFDRFSGDDREKKSVNGHYKSFLTVFNSKNVQRLREDSALLPLEEAIALHDVFVDIEREILRAEKTGQGNLPLKKEVVIHQKPQNEMEPERPRRRLRSPYGVGKRR